MLLPDPRPTSLSNLYKGFFCWEMEYVVLLIFLRTWVLLLHKFLAYIGNWKRATPKTNLVKQDWWVNVLGCSTEKGRNSYFQVGLFNVVISMFHGTSALFGVLLLLPLLNKVWWGLLCIRGRVLSTDSDSLLPSTRFLCSPSSTFTFWGRCSSSFLPLFCSF